MPDTATMAPGVGAPVVSQPITLHYNGRWQEVARIALGNALLNLVTLGLYSFWGRTRIRRYLWSHTSANGDPLEYHGTGGQIFVGFIIVSLIFAGINLGQNGLQTMLIGDVADPALLRSRLPAYILLSLAIAVAYLTFFAYVTYSVRRYWLAMTSWRGIRLRQGGKRRVLIRRAVPGALLSVLTLGLAYPWLILRTEGYAYGESHAGDRQFRFSARGWPLFRAWLPVWTISLVLLTVPLWVFLYFVLTYDLGLEPSAASGKEPLPAWLGSWLPLLPWLLFAWFGAYLVAVYIAWSYWRARLFNIAVNGLSVDGLTFTGRIRTATFVSAYLRTIGLTVAIVLATALAFVIWAAGIIVVLALVRMTTGIQEELTAVVGSLGVLAVILPFLVVFVSFGLARNIVIVHGLWKARVEATSTSGRIDTEAIRQAQIERLRSGEGLGQVFDAGFGEA